MLLWWWCSMCVSSHHPGAIIVPKEEKSECVALCFEYRFISIRNDVKCESRRSTIIINNQATKEEESLLFRRNVNNFNLFVGFCCRLGCCLAVAATLRFVYIVLDEFAFGAKRVFMFHSHLYIQYRDLRYWWRWWRDSCTCLGHTFA